MLDGFSHFKQNPIYFTTKKFLQSLISSMDGSEKGTETRHEIKECKKTALHLPRLHSRCRVVFLHSITSALFLGVNKV